MPPRSSPVVPAVDYQADRLRVIASLEASHFWFVPRHRRLLDVVSRYLPPARRVLDVGCGTGGFCDALRSRGHEVFGTDPHALEIGLDPAWYLRGTSDHLPFPDASFDAVCVFDVLEHVDDAAAITECRRVLRPGGHLFVSVPAYASLWSQRDVVAGHKRRYNRPMLRSLLAVGGFQLLELGGYQFFLLPLVWWNRLGSGLRDTCVSREDNISHFANRMLRRINHWEVSLASVFRAPPVGSSLIAVARIA
ncbi:MAG: class I SAM-dependent methyltransferase [Opitutaceae bacterium]|nr:class I SAM-dependent methyltransferase [Opitutaceae bacterium]